MSFLLSQSAFFGAIESGLIYCFVAIGIFISFRILDFPDLTVEGSFPLGAAIVVALLMAGVNPWLAMLGAALCGACCGLVTASLNQLLKIPKLLASIITGTSLYSVNLHILGGANLPLMGQDTIFTPLEDSLAGTQFNSNYSSIFLLLLLCVITILALWRYLETDNGLAMRASGINAKMSAAQGINTSFHLFVGMALSNAFVAIGGALYAQINYYADSSLGIGTIILGLAAVIIGEALTSQKRILFPLLGCLIGSVIYWILIAYAINGLPGTSPFDLNLITGIMITLVLLFANRFNKIER